jgi:hypothetical protein
MGNTDNTDKDEKVYRFLRVLEYVGTREFIDHMITNRGVKGSSPGWHSGKHKQGSGFIKEAIVGELPDLLSPDDAKDQLDFADYLSVRSRLETFLLGKQMPPGHIGLSVNIASLSELVDALITLYQFEKEIK